MHLSQLNKLKVHIDLISLVVILIMLAGFILLVFQIYSEREGTCVSNPLVYGAKQYEESTGEKVTGQLIFLTYKDAPTIIFNSQNISILK